MPEKGFDLLVDAVASLQGGAVADRPFAVVAVGSGDYLREYQEKVRSKKLDELVYFLPFQAAVLPPVSTIECYCHAFVGGRRVGLLAMEALCMGTPLIVSDCMGLRETVTGTPAKVFPSENVAALADLMLECMRDNLVAIFRDFMPAARARFDVQQSSKQLVQVIENIQAKRVKSH